MLAAVGSLTMRVFRALGLTTLGAFAGFTGAAALFKRAVPSRGGAESDDVALVAIFDGVQLKSRATAFRGGSMLAWFGGVAVDLREAQLAPDAHLALNAFCGGIAIKVPEGWRVRSSLKALAGGVDIRVPEPEDAAAPTLTLEGFALFGGVAAGARAAEAAPEP